MKKLVHYVLLDHELWFYDLCYKEAASKEKKKELKTLFKTYIRQHRKSKEIDDRVTVWAIRQILKGHFNQEAQKQFRNKLIEAEMSKHPGLYIHHHGQSSF